MTTATGPLQNLNLLDPELYQTDPQALWAELLATDELARDVNGLWWWRSTLT